MTPAQYIRAKLSLEDQKTFDTALDEVNKSSAYVQDLVLVNTEANLSSFYCRYCKSPNDPQDEGRQFARFGYFILGAKGVHEPFHLICAQKALSAWVEIQKANILVRLYAAEGVIQELVVDVRCVHPQGIGYCDSCTDEREGRVGAALAEWRKTVPDKGVPAVAPS